MTPPLEVFIVGFFPGDAPEIRGSLPFDCDRCGATVLLSPMGREWHRRPHSVPVWCVNCYFDTCPKPVEPSGYRYFIPVEHREPERRS